MPRPSRGCGRIRQIAGSSAWTRRWAPAWTGAVPPTPATPTGASGGCSGWTRYYRTVFPAKMATTTNDLRDATMDCLRRRCARSARCPTRAAAHRRPACPPSCPVGRSPRASNPETLASVGALPPGGPDAAVVLDRPAPQGGAGRLVVSDRAGVAGRFRKHAPQFPRGVAAGGGGLADDRVRDRQRAGPPAWLAAAGPPRSYPVVPGHRGMLQPAAADATGLGGIQPDRDRPRRSGGRAVPRAGDRSRLRAERGRLRLDRAGHHPAGAFRGGPRAVSGPRQPSMGKGPARRRHGLRHVWRPADPEPWSV